MAQVLACDNCGRVFRSTGRSQTVQVYEVNERDAKTDTYGNKEQRTFSQVRCSHCLIVESADTEVRID